MNVRDRAYFATSALVYSGPLYAGLAGYSFDVIPAFAVIFMLWLYVVRPQDWPQTPEAWRTPRALAWPLLILSGQMVLIGFCLVVGAGLGGILQFHAPLHLFLCLLISCLGVSVARLLQPEDARYLSHIPGEQLGIGAGILDIGVPMMDGQAGEMAYTQDIMMHLADFGQKPAPRAEIVALAAQVEKDNMARPVLSALIDSHQTMPSFTQLQSSLALRPQVAKSISGEGLVGKAFTHTLSSWVPSLIEDAAKDARALIRKVPKIAAEFPSPVRLEAAAKSVSAGNPSTAEALRALGASLGNIKNA